MIYDAPLSKTGRQQVETLRSQVQAVDGLASKVQLVVTSPLSRAIDTCLGSFFPTPTTTDTSTPTPHTTYGSRPLVIALHRERLHKSGDVGIATSELHAKYGDDRLDLSELEQHVHPEQWWYDDEAVPAGGVQVIVQETTQQTKLRVDLFLQWLSNRPETCIAVVGHSAYIKTLTKMSRKLNNCEIKLFEIE